MIQKNSKINDYILSEMLNVMESAEHKKMFQPITVTAQVMPEDTITSAPKEKIISKLTSALQKDSTNVALKRVLDAVQGKPEHITETDLQAAINSAKNLEDPTKGLLPSEAGELARLVYLPSFAQKAEELVSKDVKSFVPKIELGESPFEKAVSELPEGELPSTANIILDNLIKIANYFGENKMSNSEAAVDNLIKTIINEL